MREKRTAQEKTQQINMYLKSKRKDNVLKEKSSSRNKLKK